MNMKLKELLLDEYSLRKSLKRRLENLRYEIKSFKQGVVNLITWFKVIWSDRQFDYGYFRDILAFKLRLMEEYMKNGKFLDSSEYEKMLSKLKIASALLEKIKESFYELEYYDFIKADMDFVEVEHQDEKLYEMKVSYKDDRLDEYFAKYKRQFNQLKADYDLTKSESRSSLAHMIARNNHQRARKIFYTLIERYEEGWWD